MSNLTLENYYTIEKRNLIHKLNNNFIMTFLSNSQMVFDPSPRRYTTLRSNKLRSSRGQLAHLSGTIFDIDVIRVHRIHTNVYQEISANLRHVSRTVFCRVVKYRPETLTARMRL